MTTQCHRNLILRQVMFLIPGKLSCFERSPQEDRTLMGCTSGQLALFDSHTKLTKVISCSLVGHIYHNCFVDIHIIGRNYV